MRPKDEDVIQFNPGQNNKNENNFLNDKEGLTFIEKFENHRALNIFLGLALVTYIVMNYLQKWLLTKP